MDTSEIIKLLKKNADQDKVAGMSRFGINPENTLGISIYDLQRFAKKIGVDHRVALELWNTGIHEARILAGYIDNPGEVTEEQMENWVKDFNSWDVCDQVCSTLFDRTEFAHEKAIEWSSREEEFVKRSGFVLMATLAVHSKEADEKDFEKFFPIIIRESSDERNYVKKAVNWALRQIGKRNISLNRKAIKIAERIQKIKSRSAKWIASDALRELKSEKIQNRVAKRSTRGRKS